MDRNHVLLVEDDFVINLEMREFLEEAGFAVEAASCGFSAFVAIGRHPPAALVTDLDLGPGPDGFEVARYARAMCPGLPVIFVSGSMAGRHASEGVPGSVFIAKPCHGRQIVEALRRTDFLEVA